jgi:hypothetical protein
MRLRGQVGVLRQELAGQNRTPEMLDVQTNGLKNAWPIGSLKWVPEWKDVGLDSPESAVETYWWAIASGNSDRLQQCMAFNRGSTGETVSPLYARREVRSESMPIKSGKIEAMRLCSVSRSDDPSLTPGLEHAKVEIEMTGRSPGLLKLAY